MAEEMKERAEARLLDAFAQRNIEDNRPAYRQRLRALREHDAAAFERALRHYDDVVLPALSGADPVEAWITYGAWLAALDGPGRLLAVGVDGRAVETTAAAADGLVLFVPEETSAPALAVCLPAAPSPAQRATYDLLVLGRVELAG